MAATAGGLLCSVSAAVRAEVLLSQLIVELRDGAVTGDIDVWNSSPDRAYVAAEPREIVNPGTPAQADRKTPDPEKLGLLVAPARMILEPGQHKLLRIASIGQASATERVYRVTVRPEVGGVASEKSGLKILVGYDVLVLVRPATAHAAVVGKRTAGGITFTNQGNVSVELVDGRQCDSAGQGCVSLPGKRLYAGAEWTEPLKSASPVHYRVLSPGVSDQRVF
nr:fimbria/pilus periplasmic chaperone [Sphingomonas sp.]